MWQKLCIFQVVATIGTTNSCAIDNLETIGKICRKFVLHLHVDASYAGTALVCPEFRKYMPGIEASSHEKILLNYVNYISKNSTVC